MNFGKLSNVQNPTRIQCLLHPVCMRTPVCILYVFIPHSIFSKLQLNQWVDFDQTFIETGMNGIDLSDLIFKVKLAH